MSAGPSPQEQKRDNPLGRHKLEDEQDARRGTCLRRGACGLPAGPRSAHPVLCHPAFTCVREVAKALSGPRSGPRCNSWMATRARPRFCSPTSRVWAIGEHGIPASSDYADARQQLIGKIAGESLTEIPPVLTAAASMPATAPNSSPDRTSMGCSSAARPGRRKAISTYFAGFRRSEGRPANRSTSGCRGSPRSR